MTKKRLAAVAASILLMPFGVHAQEPQGLTIRTRIDSTYVFGFDLRESRSAKGGIWNLKTGKPETPQSYTQAKPDTLAGRPVVMLYREVVIGNHPLNGWEAWTRKDNSWVRLEEVGEDATSFPPEGILR